MKYNPGGCQNEGVNVSTFKSSKLNTLAGEALPFQLYYTVNESVPVPFFFLPPNPFPSGYWVTSHCHSSLLLDLKMFEDGLVRLHSRCRQIRGTFQRERIPVCQTKCCIPAHSQRKFVNDARNTQYRLQIPCISEAIIITLLLYTSSPTGTFPEEVVAFFWCFFEPKKPPTMSVMISFVCIVLFKSVSLWDYPPPNRSAVLQITTASSNVASFSPQKLLHTHSLQVATPPNRSLALEMWKQVVSSGRISAHKLPPICFRERRFMHVCLFNHLISFLLSLLCKMT